MPKFQKPSSFDIITRMKTLTASETDAALARYLGITPPALVQWRSRNLMPMSYCIEVAERTGASLDYIYLGVAPETAPPLASANRLLLEVVLKRGLTELGAGLAQLAGRLAQDYAAMLQRVATEALRARLSVAAAGLVVWLAEKGGEAEDVAAEAEAETVNEAIRQGMLQRVTTGTGGSELLVLTPAGRDFASRAVAQG